MFARILSTGSFLPDRTVTNDELTQFPKPTLPLIAAKTGALARRYAEDSQCTSDLALQASLRCLKKIHFDPAQLEAIILSTSSPDRILPPTASRLQHLLGASSAFALDINAVCSGGLYGLHLAESLIKSGRHKHVLVVAAEIYSRFLNPRDFSTYPYFGDGAGAALLGASPDAGMIFSEIGADGSGSEAIRIPGGGTMLPSFRSQSTDDCWFRMNGKEVYQFAVSKGTEMIERVLSVCDVRPESVTRFISHQANINIIRELAARVNVPIEKFFVNLHRYGNTASASNFIALDEAIEAGALQEGQLAVLVAFGGGLAWGASLIRL